jgi:hypothetical protein
VVRVHPTVPTNQTLSTIPHCRSPASYHAAPHAFCSPPQGIDGPHPQRARVGSHRMRSWSSIARDGSCTPGLTNGGGADSTLAAISVHLIGGD